MSLRWDLLRVVLTVSREGGLSAAARALGVNQATVSRQVARAEETLGARLFDRLSSGLAPTRAGLAIMETARRVEAEVIALELAIGGLSEDVSGPLRLSAPVGLARYGLAADIADFQRLYPDIRIEFESDDRIVDLGERKSDIAIRAQDEPAAGLWGHKLAVMEYQYYGAVALCEEWRAALQPGAKCAAEAPLPLIECAGMAAPSRDEFRAVYPNARAAAICPSLDALVPAVESGVGFGLCPCFVAKENAGLRRLRSVRSTRKKGLWVLTHPDLRRAARYRVFMDFIRDRFVARKATFAAEHDEEPAGELQL